jgi:hypothetical protein
MCHVLYLAASCHLPEVPVTHPVTFSVTALYGPAEAIVRHLPPGWQVRSAGSASGCGCDFHGAGSWPSRQALATYLAALDPQVPIRLYDCWHGDEHLPPESELVSDLTALSNSDDVLAERRMVLIAPRRASSDSTTTIAA